MWYFTADWHLNHANILKYCSRPFLSPEEAGLVELANKGSIPLKSVNISPQSVLRMNDCIIDSTNAVVGSNDNLVILGDFIWSSTPQDEIARFIDRISCKNLYLIWGNHDNRQTLKRFFKSTYDAYSFNIDGQHVFVSHYPHRSWHLSHYGSYMLYGHVHNHLSDEDNNVISPFQREKLVECLDNLQIDIRKEKVDSFIESVFSIFSKKILTLDVGVDNLRENLPFGTPWSMNDIHCYMEKKKNE